VTDRDDFLEIANLEGELEDEFGERDFIVYLAHEVYDRTIHAGAILLSRTTERMVPPPRVVKLDDEVSSSFQSTNFASRNNLRKGSLAGYKLSGITPAFDTGTATGGYSLEALAPSTASTFERYVFIVVGPGIEDVVPTLGGAPFQIAGAPMRESAFENSVLVRRAPYIVQA
jgi:hypothetical protein